VNGIRDVVVAYVETCGCNGYSMSTANGQQTLLCYSAEPKRLSISRLYMICIGSVCLVYRVDLLIFVFGLRSFLFSVCLVSDSDLDL